MYRAINPQVCLYKMLLYRMHDPISYSLMTNLYSESIFKVNDALINHKQYCYNKPKCLVTASHIYVNVLSYISHQDKFP